MKKANLLLYMKSTIPILIICVILFSCKQSIYQDSCNENPEYKDKLFVFIGEKISVDMLPQEEYSMDVKFKAIYKVIQPICGNYNRDTIEFIVYDHYGRPEFENYKDVMLFVTNYDDTFYHEKYQYFDVYKTQSNEWASSYNYGDYERLDSNSNIRPEEINFLHQPAYDVKYISKKIVQREYPSPYYKIVGDSAVAIQGNYLDDLLELKKQGILAARKIFGDTSASHPSPMIVQDVQLADVLPEYKISFADSIEFMKFFKAFISAIEKKDSKSIKNMSLGNVDCSVCEGFPIYYYLNGVESIDEFVNASKLLIGSTLWEEINKTHEYKINAVVENTLTQESSLQANNKTLDFNIDFKAKVDIPDYTDIQHHTFRFKKINGEFKFVGMISN